MIRMRMMNIIIMMAINVDMNNHDDDDDDDVDDSGGGGGDVS